jgi:formamidopyrimidine-DNA glycosylase
MPELPEVETVRRGLLPLLAGQRLRTVVQRRPDLRFPLPEGFAARLAGRRVMAIDRHGKYLLFRLDGDLVWLAHLGMSGRFRTGDEAAAGRAPLPHDHLLVETDEGVCVRFHDPRRFGFMDLMPAEAVIRHPMLATLGPDPLGPAFTARWLADRCHGRLAPIKAVLLDQRVVAGMGNIYASESLFRAGLAPARPAGALGEAGVRRLFRAIGAVFRAAIAAGGSSLRDHRQPSGELGFFQHQFAVYGRAGLPCPGCRCRIAETGGIRRIVQSGRSTYFCGSRQR